jgi:antitoxin component of MazEF toxin-antitoxin module
MKTPDPDLKHIGTRRISKRGGSLQVTIPETVTQFLELEKGERLAFIIDKKRNCVIIGKPDTATMRVKFSTFGEGQLEYKISGKLAEKLLGKRLKTLRGKPK